MAGSVNKVTPGRKLGARSHEVKSMQDGQNPLVNMSIARGHGGAIASQKGSARSATNGTGFVISHEKLPRVARS